MSIATSSLMPKHGDRMTFEEFKSLNLPESSSLSLLNGVVYDDAWPDQEEVMTKRNHQHARVESQLSFLLHTWQTRSKFACRVFSGEVGCEVPDRGLDVGIDVAVFADDIVARSKSSSYIQGIPMLAIEILSPSDKQSSIKDKIDSYLNAGVPLVWQVDPHFRTVVVFRPGMVPEMFATGATLDGGVTLPGLQLPVSEVFA
jgi:Uma2 family endonuclease